MPVNPKIIQKIEKTTLPPKLKQLIQNVLEVEEENEAINTHKQIVKTYDRWLDMYVKDDELIKFCDQYGNSS